jgi:hypothetical protein
MEIQTQGRKIGRVKQLYPLLRPQVSPAAGAAFGPGAILVLVLVCIPIVSVFWDPASPLDRTGTTGSTATSGFAPSSRLYNQAGRSAHVHLGYTRPGLLVLHRLCLNPLKSALCKKKKKDFSSHQTCDTCMKY